MSYMSASIEKEGRMSDHECIIVNGINIVKKQEKKKIEIISNFSKDGFLNALRGAEWSDWGRLNISEKSLRFEKNLITYGDEKFHKNCGSERN